MDEGDFESLLDAAFGLDNAEGNVAKDAAAPGPDPTTAAAPKPVTSYLSSSPSPSPAASPVHTYPSWGPPGSPCVSDVSMQMHHHASPPHDSNGSGEQQYDPQLLYSPVRESSPVPEVADECNVLPITGSNPARSAQEQQQQQQQAGVQAVVDPPAAAGHRVQAASRQRTSSPSRSKQLVSLSCLPREVQMRVMCFLSADSLTSLAQTCSQFRALCSEPVLWRRLFVHRWGKNVRHSSAQGWKVRYMERDGAELQAAGAGAQHRDVMQDIFLQAHKAKRHKSLGIGAVDDLMLVEDDEVAARVLAWRKSRGFVTQSGPGSDAQPQRPADITLPKGVAAAGGSAHRAAACAGAAAAAAGAGAGINAGSGVGRRVMRRSVGGSSGASHGGMAGVKSATDAGGGAAAAADSAAAGASGGSQVQSAPVAAASQTSTAGGASQDAAAATGSKLPAPSPVAVTAPAAAAGAAAAASGGGSGGSSSSRVVQLRRRSRQPRRWTQIGNVFCDEQTGWVHVCDETCSEKIVEPSSGLLVCPISGTCSARFLTCAEEDEEEGDRDPEKEHREEDFGGERGRLARAFAAGYYCDSERELMRECGVCLPR